jgi:hypothetical protein
MLQCHLDRMCSFLLLNIFVVMRYGFCNRDTAPCRHHRCQPSAYDPAKGFFAQSGRTRRSAPCRPRTHFARKAFDPLGVLEVAAHTCLRFAPHPSPRSTRSITSRTFVAQSIQRLNLERSIDNNGSIGASGCWWRGSHHCPGVWLRETRLSTMWMLDAPTQWSWKYRDAAMDAAPATSMFLGVPFQPL